jgi:hypothetical protein
VGFLEERVYSHNSRSVEDLKRNTEEAVAGIDQRCLQNVAAGHRGKDEVSVKKVGDIFGVCCN